MISSIPLEKRQKSIQLKKQVKDFLINGGVIQDLDSAETVGNAQSLLIKKTKPNKKGIK